MNSIAITKPANKPKWAEVAVKYNCKKLSKPGDGLLSKQRKLTKEVDEVERQINCFGWKAARTYSGMRFHVAFVTEGDVNIMENVLSRNGLGSSWIILCQNESCPSQSTNSAFTTTEKGKGFEVIKATILGLRSTGSGHAVASKCLSFIGLAPISMSFLGSSTCLWHLFWHGHNF